MTCMFHTIQSKNTCKLQFLNIVEISVLFSKTAAFSHFSTVLAVLESWLDHSGELEPPDPLSRLPQLKQRIRQLLCDLCTVRRLSVWHWDIFLLSDPWMETRDGLRLCSQGNKALCWRKVALQLKCLFFLFLFLSCFSMYFGLTTDFKKSISHFTSEADVFCCLQAATWWPSMRWHIWNGTRWPFVSCCLKATNTEFQKGLFSSDIVFRQPLISRCYI